jgi:PAS domain S-box-containing protein
MVFLQTLQKIQDNYTVALGIPIYIKNLEGSTLTLPNKPGKLWDLIHRNPQAENEFLTQVKEAIDKCNRTGQIVLFERHPDTESFLAPIYASGKIIAYFIGGLVRYGNPNLKNAELQAKLLNVSTDEYLDAFLNLPFFTRERLEASANLIRIIGSTIYSMENQEQENRELNHEFQEKNQQLAKNLEKTAKELSISENRYKQLFDTVNDGIYTSDLNDQTFLDINNAGAKILGYDSPQDLIGKKIDNMYVFPRDRDNFINILKSKGHIRNWLAHIITPSGEEKYVETNATVIHDEKNNRDTIEGIFRDLNFRQHRSV